MSYEKVRAYFDSAGLLDHITERARTGDTAEHAAEAVGFPWRKSPRP